MLKTILKTLRIVQCAAKISKISFIYLDNVAQVFHICTRCGPVLFVNDILNKPVAFPSFLFYEEIKRNASRQREYSSQIQQLGAVFTKSQRKL